MADPMTPVSVQPQLETAPALSSVEQTEGISTRRAEILSRIDDSIKIERDWRSVGQKIQLIYRGESDAKGIGAKNSSRFNSLNSNTTILLPSLFSKAPKPDIRAQSDSTNPFIDQACTVLEKLSEVILETSDSFEAIKAAVLEVLLPGRGTCRIRWDPIVEVTAVPDPMNPAVMTEQYEKLLDRLYLEHVYWEDFTYEQTASWKDTGWVAFRHLMTEETFMMHFGDEPIVQQWVTAGKKNEIFRWTDKTAGRSREGNNTPNNAENLQDVILKAMVWEYWDKSTREVIWLSHDMGGFVLRTSPDPMGLTNFFPCPRPLVAITTTDQQLPVAEYTIYQDLAVEVDSISDRIDAIVKRIKVIGAYDGAQDGLKEILRQEDGNMLAVNGLDINFDLNKHIWMLPLNELIQALQILYQSRNESKQAMYEVTGISDIVRGQTRASETLGAQQMKTQFAALRIEDRKRSVEFFSQHLVELICEVVAKHFSPESIYYYTDIQVYPETMQILQTDGLRISRIRIETDSTVMADAAGEQENMAKMLQALGFVLQQVGPLVQGGILPLPIAMELVKLALRPFKHSRKITELLDQAMMALTAQAGAAAVPGGAPGQPMPGSPASQQLQVIQGGAQ
jgi:hypothetical protein